MKITLTNDFHNTTVNLVATAKRLNAKQVKRAKKALCGIDGCTCSDDLGMRGSQTVIIRVNWDGSAQIA